MKIQVIAHPHSKRPLRQGSGQACIEKDLLGTLHVYVSQPPLEGKANKAVIDALAHYFNVNRSSVILLSGEKSKHKRFEIIES